jgi:hypothetical protein
LLRKLALLGSVAALLGSSVFISGSGAAGTAIDNSNATVHCGTITKGLIKPKPTLVNGGTSATVIAISGTLGGCSSSDSSITFPEGKSKFKGTLNSSTNDCAGLAGPSTSTGSITITWGTSPAVTHKTTVVSIPSGGSVGNFASVAGDLHGTFDLGAPAGSALSATGGFTGGDNGAASKASVVTQESVNSILAGCANIKGLKQINIGVGSIDVG